MALLPKPRWGFRTIAKTPMLYRLWGVCRRPLVKAWEVRNEVPWDRARPGSSALTAAYERGFDAEVAIHNNEQVGTILWDFAKFFDYIDGDLLYKAGQELQFPRIDLDLGLSMHYATRWLVALHCFSADITVYRSILAGCSLAIPFTRVYLRNELEPLIERYDMVTTTVYVDDISQMIIGSIRFVAHFLACVALSFAQIAQRLKLQLVDPDTGECKSTIVASHPAIVAEVGFALRTLGLKLSHAPFCRDLGLLFSIHRARRTRILAPRLREGGRRLRQVHWMARIDRNARRLARANPLPCAFWGAEAIGVSPTSMRRIRSQTAAASGIVAHSRCATTAIRIGFHKDPAVEHVQRILQAWFAKVKDHPIPSRLLSAWRSIRARICTGGVLGDDRVYWNRVTGPISALIATLVHYGWHPVFVDGWKDPEGSYYFMRAGAAVHSFINCVLDTVRDALWQSAAKHYMGKGLDSEPIWGLLFHAQGAPGRWHARPSRTIGDNPLRRLLATSEGSRCLPN